MTLAEIHEQIQRATETLDRLNGFEQWLQRLCEKLLREKDPAWTTAQTIKTFYLDARYPDYDPTPWCLACGARRQQDCHCGPIADNE